MATVNDQASERQSELCFSYANYPTDSYGNIRAIEKVVMF